MNGTEDGAGEQETFHIYILSFTYGLMMVGSHTAILDLARGFLTEIICSLVAGP